MTRMETTLSGALPVRTVRTLLVAEALVFLIGPSIHHGRWIAGFEHGPAATAESVIGFALLLGAALTWTMEAFAQPIAIVAQAFALLGTLIGVFVIVKGVGPQSEVDKLMHVVLAPTLAWGLLQFATRRISNDG